MGKDDFKRKAAGKSRGKGARAVFAVLFLIAVGIAGVSIGQRHSFSEESQVAKENISINKKKLLFFINPNGYPCQLQENILSENAGKIESYANIEYVSTTVKSDRGKFYKYGIRALPSIVLLDKEGNVVKRFSPGIKKIEEIMQYIKREI